MEILKQKLKGKTQLVFIDFEGTESTHEMISIGAVKATLDFKGHFKRQYPLFYTLVKPSTPLTRFIIQFTKITQQEIDEKGVSLSEGIQKLVKYIGAASLKKILGLRLCSSRFSPSQNCPIDVARSQRTDVYSTTAQELAGFSSGAFPIDARFPR